MTPETVELLMRTVPFGGMVVGLALFAKLVSVFTRLSDEARKYLRELRAGLRAEAEHRVQERKFWEAALGEDGRVVKLGFARPERPD